LVSIAFRRSRRSRLLNVSGHIYGGFVVSIAFRRSRRSRRDHGVFRLTITLRSPLPFGVHGGPDSTMKIGFGAPAQSLHCLSAFTAVPTRISIGLRFARLVSPLPFGVHGGPDKRIEKQRPNEHIKVSIAFRRSRRSRLYDINPGRKPGSLVSIAFRRSRRSRLPTL